MPVSIFMELRPIYLSNDMEGLNHIPTAIKPGIYDSDFADRTIDISTEETYEMNLRLAREEGLLVGISAATAMVGALQIAEEAAELGDKATIVTLFPDNASKYLSHAPWA